MLFRQFFDHESATYSYLLADPVTREAVLIDSVAEQHDRDVEQIRQLDLELRYVLDTHVHADHVTGAGLMRERLGARTIGGRGGAPCVDIAAGEGDRIRVGALELRVLATPGHTNDSVSYLVEGRVFTGDALLVRGAGRTDFQNGDAAQLYDSLTKVLFALPEETIVYPAHDYRGLTCSTIGEEKRFNTRVAGRTREEFIALMAGLQLPQPRRIQEAVPANLACGRPAGSAGSPSNLPNEGETAMNESTKGNAYRDVTASELAALAPPPRIIDVREPDEFHGELGHLPRAELVPLATLAGAASPWRKSERVVVVCRSGGRSARAAQQLVGLGFERVLNLSGGMLAANEAKVAIERT